jgi:hypothetical protein
MKVKKVKLSKGLKKLIKGNFPGDPFLHDPKSVVSYHHHFFKALVIDLAESSFKH